MLVAAAMLIIGMGAIAQQQPAGSIRGAVRDKDFGTPLAAAQVLIVETSQRTNTTAEGSFVLSGVPAGKYTVVFFKEGYVRVVRPDVIVLAGQLTDVEAELPGEFTDMDEFVVQDILQGGTGTEAALLGLRFESSSVLDSISSDFISRAGAGDAASALKLVSGASIQDGKFAVIRGLPDRYVSSQVNGVRLPSADENTRAVELDLFPAAVIESIQVTKTFTPDQQGDASGGAVDVRLKSIPDETIFQINTQVSGNSQVTGNDDFISYDGGGVHFPGDTDGKGIQYDNIGKSWTGATGVTKGNAPIDYKWSATAGGKHDLENGWTVGGLVTGFYEQDSSFFDDGKDNSYWRTAPGNPLTPKTNQGTPSDGDFKTALFDVTESTESINWGGLGTLGIENENNSLGLTYLYTRETVSTATLAEDTNGKKYFFPGYNPDDPSSEGNQPGNLNAAPYIRTDTLDYAERETGTLQLNGTHVLPMEDFSLGTLFDFSAPEVDWTLSDSDSSLDEPDKRQFGAIWLPESQNPGFPPFVPPFTTPETWLPYKPGANFNLGNLQRIYKTIDEHSKQGALNLKLPFQQWDGHEGYFKFGYFADRVKRTFDQETFSNFGDSGSFYLGGWDDPWSVVFPSEDHPINASNTDVDYKGKQDITAEYGMVDLPVTSKLNIIGGARYESTQISIINQPEADAVWFPPGATAPVKLNPGDADVDFSQDDLLPSLGLVYRFTEEWTLRASYSQTIARQTFKELTPIVQQEFLGGPVFIGNPDLQTAELTNDDLRLDYVPRNGELYSASWFNKDIKGPIENVQKIVGFDYTTPENYPDGNLNGFEFEVRQALGNYTEDLDGLSVGANATFINSEVTLPASEAAAFAAPAIDVPITSRDATNAPDHLYNLYVTYDVESTGTQFALFYTIKGDTLIAGAGQSNGNFVPSVYAKEYGTLNLSVSQEVTEQTKVTFQAKNLTNEAIETVYGGQGTDGETLRSSYTLGREFSIGLSVRF